MINQDVTNCVYCTVFLGLRGENPLNNRVVFSRIFYAGRKPGKTVYAAGVCKLRLN